MDSSRARIIGPAVAVGAVSAGLILIGACGVGRQDTYVAPPPLKNGPALAAAPVRDDVTSSSTPKVIIPPSPSWRMAPNMPRQETNFTVPPSGGSTTETTTPGRSPSATAEADDPTLTLPPRTTASDDEPLNRTTVRPRPTTSAPTTTRPAGRSTAPSSHATAEPDPDE
ncbi:hypothetical protein D5S18_01745 [Nocardia panacis]|uniref:Uncharacterized protein n=1 Tax=Nocardia panacis TaxID=2340916 RepID=A0A3A4K4B4_9NOCA|nr:hypothetical protein [Nocardia panacis]RJO79994.1 hypothetical protein D5S18_01745 [Nocardia panacis]